MHQTERGLAGYAAGHRQHQGRFQRQSRRTGKPVGIIFKGGAFAVAGAARPQAPNKMRDTNQIVLDQQFTVAHGFTAMRGWPRAPIWAIGPRQAASLRCL